MHWLIIGDPLDALHPRSDTGLAIAHTAHARGIAVEWALIGDVTWWDRGVRVHARPVRDAAWRELPTLGELATRAALDYDAILIRKDPPFDAEYARLCWLLSTVESKVVVSNCASVLLTHHEKIVPWLAHAAGDLRDDDIVPTCVTAHPDEAAEFARARGGDDFVVKPWLGFGGSGVQRVATADAVRACVAAAHAPMMIQTVLPEIFTHGDRRVFFFNGEVVGSLVRTPRPGEIVSNLAAGGTGSLRPLDARALDVCTRLGGYLKRAGIDFAGADLIGEYISEVNITAPTGLIGLVNLGGENLLPKLVEMIVEKSPSLKGRG